MLTKPPKPTGKLPAGRNSADPSSAKEPSARSPLPSVDAVAQHRLLAPAIEAHGRSAVIASIRRVILGLRQERQTADADECAARALAEVEADMAPSLKPVFNLTGTVLHTNLGRASMPAEAAQAAYDAMTGTVNLEYDLEQGGRGERDDHVRSWLCRLTGAEDATVVNNNAAAVLLVLNSLALRREVPVSRGELIEIGGAFRMPDIMSRAGCKLVEVGTTNRTHAKDFAAAIGPKTAMLMKVHPSNYVISGFTKVVPDADMAAVAAKAGIPYVVDLGSGTLVDLERYGLPHEPTPAETLKAGADLVTFSGDKLLGGPQAGVIVGRKALIDKINRNPMKRALRLDKGRLAALETVLRLYASPERLHDRLTAIRLLARPEAEIRALADRLMQPVADCLGGSVAVSVEACRSQIGSGSLPIDRLPSACLALVPSGGGKALKDLALRLRRLPKPVIGRIEDGRLKLDLRCLTDEAGFLSSLRSVAR